MQWTRGSLKQHSTVKATSCHSATPMGSVSFAAECRHHLQYHADHVANALTSKSSKCENARTY
eukprot:5163029-Ditylum_brightwellii.AAC.1